MLLLLAIVIYDFHHKRNPFSVLLMALCRLLVFVVAALALSGRVEQPVLVAAGIQFAYVVLISLVARHENSRLTPFPFPVIPAMIAGISLVNTESSWPAWCPRPAGIAGALLTWAGQRFVRGD